LSKVSPALRSPSRKAERVGESVKVVEKMWADSSRVQIQYRPAGLDIIERMTSASSTSKRLAAFSAARTLAREEVSSIGY